MAWTKPCTAINFAGLRPATNRSTTGAIRHRGAGKSTAWDCPIRCLRKFITCTQSGCFASSKVTSKEERNEVERNEAARNEIGECGGGQVFFACNPDGRTLARWSVSTVR